VGASAQTIEHFDFGTSVWGQAYPQSVPAEIIVTPTSKWVYGIAGDYIKFTIAVDYTCFSQTFEVRVEDLSFAKK
jgi:hypothetical protein